MCYDNYYPYLRTLLLFFENLDYTMLAFSLKSNTSARKSQLNLLYIIVTAAPEEVPQTLINQLKEGGRLIIPIGRFVQELIRIIPIVISSTMNYND